MEYLIAGINLKLAKSFRLYVRKTPFRDRCIYIKVDGLHTEVLVTQQVFLVSAGTGVDLTNSKLTTYKVTEDFFIGLY